MDVKIRIGWLLLALLAGFAAWFFWLREPGYEYVNNPPAAAGPWVALGDSLTEGYGATEGHDYPAVLGQQLGVKILNFGRSGDTTADALKRLDGVLSLNPRVVLLCLGVFLIVSPIFSGLAKGRRQLIEEENG